MATTSVPLPTDHGYGQVCAVALALDDVGPRWNLLILRDLARTPLRFSDLEAINPGLSPAVLSNRLRGLQACGLIEQRATRNPGRTSVYAIVDTARPALTRVLAGLAELGAFFLDTNPPNVDPATAFAAQMDLNARFVLARDSSLEGYFELDLTAWSTHVIIEDGAMTTPLAAPAGRVPDAVARFTPPTTLMRVTGRAQSLEEAELAGHLIIDGDRAAMAELLRLLSIEPTPLV